MGIPDVVIDGVVEEADAPRKLVHTYRFLFSPEMKAEGFTRVTWEIEKVAAGFSRLTVIHELEGAPIMAGMVASKFSEMGTGGWGWLLSDLKSLPTRPGALCKPELNGMGIEHRRGNCPSCDDMGVIRLPRAPLRPFVEVVWAMDETPGAHADLRRREHVIPTGGMHVVFRLFDDPLRLFDDQHDREGRTVGTMVVGGARARFYIRDVSKPLSSVGAMLRPGAAEVLFGVHADELSEAHTALEDLWGPRAVSMRDQLGELSSPEERLDALERMLADRLPTVRGLHPAVAQALQEFRATKAVRDVVRESGYSHRQFITLFSRAVGLTPKMYCRVLRFQLVLRRAGTGGLSSLIDVAMASGYSDQSHFNREFREFTGITPTEYRAAAPATPHHVLVDSQ